jgi:pimeloyl-ACP methyl ester carboxylesterase
MSQLVFIHGNGAGGCADAYYYQRDHFPDSLIPTLPGHPDGANCLSIARYTDWLRGWLSGRGHNKNLILVGYTLGASIALQYALDYPEEVRGLILMSVAARPKVFPPGTYELRLRAAEDPKVYEEWLGFQRRAMHLLEPNLRERLIERHRAVGPMSQYYDTKSICEFDVSDRIATLKPRLLLLRGLDDPGSPPQYEKEIHDAVPGSRYITLPDAAHFPMAEIPGKVNAIIEEFVAAL